MLSGSGTLHNISWWDWCHCTKTRNGIEGYGTSDSCPAADMHGWYVHTNGLLLLSALRHPGTYLKKPSWFYCANPPNNPPKTQVWWPDVRCGRSGAVNPNSKPNFNPNHLVWFGAMFRQTAKLSQSLVPFPLIIKCFNSY